MGKAFFGFVWKVVLKLIIVLITIFAYLAVDRGFSLLEILGLSLSNSKQMDALDILVISTILTVIVEGIIEFCKKVWEHTKDKTKIEVKITVKETVNKGDILYFSKDSKLKNVILSYEIAGNDRKHIFRFLLPLGKVRVVFPDWVTVNQQLDKKVTGHTRAIQVFEQNREKGISHTYIEIDLKKSSNFGSLNGSKDITLPLICEDDDYVSSKSPLVIEWNESKNWFRKHFNTLKSNDFEFTYTHSEKERHT